MQEKLKGHIPCDDKELICINVDKVYDWIVKENSFDIFPTAPISFPGVTPTTNLANATVTCEVTPAATNPIVIQNRENRPFSIDGKTVYLQQLNIQKNFSLTLFVTLENGTVLTSVPVPISRCEQVTLCAPEGTDVEITYTELNCFICSTGTLILGDGAPGAAPVGTIGFTALTITVSTCQSIQSTFPVTVEFLADYCEPRADLPMACPGPVRPHDCSLVFPDDHCRH